MRSFEIEHADPHPLARSAAIRARTEQDPRTREAARRMTGSQRLATAVELSRFATRLRSARR